MNMIKPIIGTFPLVEEDGILSSVRNDYVSAIVKSGGIEIALPYTEDIEIIRQFIERCDGILFTGGVDIDPKYYGEENGGKVTATSHYRDTLETLAISEVLKTDKPVLGICRGCQMINVGLGGTLIQDIPSEVDTTLIHRQDEPHSAPSHSVTINKDSLLFDIIKEERIGVNSLHHQSVKKVGKGLEIVARADDGVVEAICDKNRKFFFGIQWHPERSFETEESSRAIFKAFIDACKK